VRLKEIHRVRIEDAEGESLDVRSGDETYAGKETAHSRTHVESSECGGIEWRHPFGETANLDPCYCLDKIKHE
ncbi:hypothetical protein A2U01_0040825, partial [Trifolium medium]|nr:hypothetical protein [Trifolium medium]